MLEKVIAFLLNIGVTDAGSDGLVNIIVDYVTQYIKNETNQPEVPEGLIPLGVNMAAGRYLQSKKASGQLTGFDLSAAVKQIQMGDTSTTLADGPTPEKRLDNLIAYLLSDGANQFAAYRRVQW